MGIIHIRTRKTTAIIYAALFAASLIAGIVMFFLWDSAESKPVLAKPHTKESHPPEPSRAGSSAVPQPSDLVGNSTQPHIRVRRTTSLSAMLEKTGPQVSALAVLADPDSWIKRARAGDEIAAFAMYNTVANCLKIGGNSRTEQSYIFSPPRHSGDCSNLSLDEATDRLQWLVPAAEQGSPIAQFMYGNIAKTLDPELRAAQSQSQKLVDINNLALRYLTAAADYGLEDAYVELFSAYKHGTYGTIDIVKAYGNIATLATLSQNPLYEQVRDNFGKTLRAYELKTGRAYSDQLVQQYNKKHAS